MNQSGNRVTEKKKPPTRYVWLHVLPDDIWLHVPEGQTLWEALQNTDVDIGGDCGGLGNCGKCKIKLLSEIGDPSSEEKKLLSVDELSQGVRLACRTVVKQDSVISTGEAIAEAEYFKILTTSHLLKTRYIPTSQLEPLIEKRLITLINNVEGDELSYLDAIKRALEPEFQDLSASLSCLRTLPQRLNETQFQGAAVLHEHFLMEWQDKGQIDHQYGLAFDLGTSTLVGKLFNLADGSEVAVTSCLNSQYRYGADVISRLLYCQQHPAGQKRLHKLLIKDLNQIIMDLLGTAGLKQEDIFIAVAAGNTTMEHFLLDLSPLGIAQAPFLPVLTDGLTVKAADVGLQLNPEALLYTMPMKSGYIGGDLLSVVLTSGVMENDDIILGLDLGTNGEIFLGSRKRLLTCSAAAGPALEGARISSGMIAKAGAIEGVSIKDNRIVYSVIGNIAPKGLCGSGLVDLVAILLHCGVIDVEGLICHPQGKTRGLRVSNHLGVNDFLIASAVESFRHQPIYLTQRDVREFQLAKGAIAAGIDILIDELGIEIQDIRHVYLAGALGNYVNPISTLRTGLLPSVNPEIIVSLGNAASTGASMVLLAKQYWHKAAELVHSIEHVELSYRTDFNEYFTQHMNFPGNNLW